MAYEVHARFWLQPHGTLCVLAGVGSAHVVAKLDKGVFGGRRRAAPAALAVAAAFYAHRTQQRWGALDASDAWAMHAHGSAVLNVPPGALLLSHTDLHWNPARYVRTCEAQRDVTHVSLQLLPYPWFERQRGLYERVTFPEIDAATASTDVRSEAYEAMLLELVRANSAEFEQAGIFVDMHGVFEPRIGAMGLWGGRFALVPWGLSYRVVGRDLLRDAESLLRDSLRQLELLRQEYASRPGGVAALERFRPGTWERAALCAYHDAHYQAGLWALTFAQQLRLQLGGRPELFDAFLGALRSAWELTVLAAVAADRGALTSSPRDAEKNALLAAVTLHGALSVAAKLSPAKTPGAAPGPSPEAELRALSEASLDRARRFVDDRRDDRDHAVFANFLATLERALA